MNNTQRTGQMFQFLAILAGISCLGALAAGSVPLLYLLANGSGIEMREIEFMAVSALGGAAAAGFTWIAAAWLREDRLAVRSVMIFAVLAAAFLGAGGLIAIMWDWASYPLPRPPVLSLHFPEVIFWSVLSGYYTFTVFVFAPFKWGFAVAFLPVAFVLSMARRHVR